VDTIDQESKLRIRVPLDLDNMSVRYVTENSLYTFTSPSFWTIEKNLFYLMRNSVQIDFDISYKYKPDYFCYDEYGTVQLAYMIMYVNNVFCFEDFDLVTIIIPTTDAILEICKDKFPKQELDELTPIKW